MRVVTAALTAILAVSAVAFGQVGEGGGNPLQLFSFQLVGPAPVVDGSMMSRDGDPSSKDALDEWKSACSRTLKLNDGGIVQLFLTNTDDTLYIGLAYEHGNNATGSGVSLFLDEGGAGTNAAIDGNGDLDLTNYRGLANEQRCGIYSDGSSDISSDGCWRNGAWADDGDGAIDFRAARNFFSAGIKVHHYEFAIPLTNKLDDSTNSDLNVRNGQSIGFFMKVRKMGSGAGTFYWVETNGDSTAPYLAPYWGYIKLGVQRDYFTFYSANAANGVPTIDGRINEAAWQGAAQRDIILSNYHYSAIPATVWSLQDVVSGYVYVGVRVYDAQHAAGDYCRIYLEADGTNAADTMRNYLLDNGSENSLSVSAGGTLQDSYWDTPDAVWTLDTEAPDSQLAAAHDTTRYTDYEFRIQTNGGAQDISVPSDALLGFLIRYGDANMGDSLGNYFWEYTTNNDAQLLDQNGNPDVYLSTGWSYLQLGAPYAEVTSPVALSRVQDSVLVRVKVMSDTAASVVFLTRSNTTPTALADSGSGVWRGMWNLVGHAVGPDTLIVRVVTRSGFTLERLVTVGVRFNIAAKNPRAVRNAAQSLAVWSTPGGSALIRFAVQPADRARSEQVSLRIHDLRGTTVRTVLSGQLGAGTHSVVFDGRNADGSRVPPGAYVCRMTTESSTSAARFTVVR